MNKIETPFQTKGKAKNLILIGMPGVGKTTLGEQLAEKTGWDFLDTDVLLETKHEATLQELIDSRDHLEFCQIEEELLLSLNYKNHIIATGGSVVYGQAAMTHLKAIGIIIYLELELITLEKRLTNYDDRGVANPSGYTFEDIYKERIPLYKRYADITINCNKQSTEQIIQKILTII